MSALGSRPQRPAVRSAGPRRRPTIAKMLASVGIRLWPGPPAAGEPGREAWVERRRGALLGQIDQVRRRRPGDAPGPSRPI
jgi:hypothetical protein